MLGSVEFANQLCLLHDMESTKNNISDYLTKWLVTVLGDRSSTTATAQDFPAITKKVRDEVCDTFRRSGHWMTIKVLLHLNLTIELGSADGSVVYKLIMLKFLTSVCDLYNGFAVLDIDLMNQMLAKLARRIEKLTNKDEPMETSNDITAFHTHVIDEAKAVILKIRIKLNRQIEEFIQMMSENLNSHH